MQLCIMYEMFNLLKNLFVINPLTRKLEISFEGYSLSYSVKGLG